MMGDLRMHKENCEQLQKHKIPNLNLVGFLMGVVALAAPYEFYYYPSVHSPEIRINSVMWILKVDATEWYFRLHNYLNLPLGYLFQSIVIVWYLIGIRILYAYQTVKYFQGKTTRNRFIALGVVADLPWVGLLLVITFEFVIDTVMGVMTSFGFTFPIPIPCMLIFGMLLLRYFPAPGESDWDLERETKKWLPETSPDSTKA
jgi:hypothetical protein